MAKAIYLLLLICAYFSVTFAIPPNTYGRKRDLDLRAFPRPQATAPSLSVSESISRRGVIGTIVEVADFMGKVGQKLGIGGKKPGKQPWKQPGKQPGKHKKTKPKKLSPRQRVIGAIKTLNVDANRLKGIPKEIEAIETDMDKLTRNSNSGRIPKDGEAGFIPHKGVDLAYRKRCLQRLKMYDPKIAQYLALKTYGDLDNKGKDGKQEPVGDDKLRAILKAKESPTTEAARLKDFQQMCSQADLLAPYPIPGTKSRRGIIGVLGDIGGWMVSKLSRVPKKAKPKAENSVAKKQLSKPTRAQRRLVNQRLSELHLDKNRFKKIDVERESLARDITKKDLAEDDKEELSAKLRCIEQLVSYRPELVQFMALTVHGDLPSAVGEPILRSILGVERSAIDGVIQDVFEENCATPAMLEPYAAANTKSRRGIIGPIVDILQMFGVKTPGAKAEPAGGKHAAPKKEMPKKPTKAQFRQVNKKLSQLHMDEKRLKGLRAELESMRGPKGQPRRGLTAKHDCLQWIQIFVAAPLPRLAQYFALTVHGGLNMDATTLRTILEVEETRNEKMRLRKFREHCPKLELLAPYKAPNTKSRRGFLGTARIIGDWLGKLGGRTSKAAQKAGGNPSQGKGKGDGGTDKPKNKDKTDKPTQKEAVQQALKTYDLTTERLKPEKLAIELKRNDLEWGRAGRKSGNIKGFVKSDESERFLAKYRCVQALQKFAKEGRAELAQYYGLWLHWKGPKPGLMQLAAILGVEDDALGDRYTYFRGRCGNRDALKPV